ncbi:MAG: hypothetical protein ACHQ53_06895 [Polyangiales bacterium]
MERAPNRAAELADMLPDGADSCVVTRPALAGPERSALFARISQAEPMVWSRELRVTAYAASQRVRRDGPPSRVGLLWLDASAERVRAVLASHGERSLAWPDSSAACSPGACTGRASFVAPHVLRIERGPQIAAASPGAERHCKRMARVSEAAIELASTRARGLAGLSLGGMPLLSSTVLALTPEGVHVRRSDLLPSAAEAARIATDEMASEVLLAPLGSLASNLRREQVDADLRTEYDVLFEDLELAVQDDARLAEVELTANALDQRGPDPADEPIRRQDVLAEIGQRLERAQKTPKEQRRAEIDVVRGLLERALARVPDDEGLAFLLAELWMTELGEGAKVGELARRFAKSGSSAPARWALLCRHAAALAGAATLEKALIEDHVVERKNARDVAREIALRLAEGAPYEQAERAVVGASKRP